MDRSTLSVCIAILFAVICSVYSEESVHSTGLNEAADSSSSSDSHQPQKRSAVISPDSRDFLLEDDGNLVSPYAMDMDKRSSLFRFGKRSSLFRFGKRGGTLFRFGKRGGTLFRFGRSGPSAFADDESSVKRSDGQLLRLLAEERENAYPTYLDQVLNKRGVDSFHWGQDSDE